MKNKFDKIKTIGLIATITGLAIELVSDWVKDKEMEEKIDEKLNQKISELNQ